MAIQILTLSENTAGIPRLMSEWGISILVEMEDQKILFDTGQRISAACNANVLGVNLPGIDKIALSHGHFDHTGGLRHILMGMKKEVEVIAHPDIWDTKYAKRPDSNYMYIGIPFQKNELESLGANFVYTRDAMWLNDNLVIPGEIPLANDYEEIDPGLLIKKGDQFKPDPLLDDRALIIKTELGLVVIAGCAHRGIINTLNYARELTGEKRIHAVMGGIHLMYTSEIRMELTIAAFREMDVQRIGVSHCTGQWASARLAQEFGDKFFFNNAGTAISFP